MRSDRSGICLEAKSVLLDVHLFFGLLLRTFSYPRYHSLSASGKAPHLPLICNLRNGGHHWAVFWMGLGLWQTAARGRMGGAGGLTRREVVAKCQLQREKKKTRNMDETHDQISTCICTVDGAEVSGNYPLFFFVAENFPSYPRLLVPDYFTIITRPLFGLLVFTLLRYLLSFP